MAIEAGFKFTFSAADVVGFITIAVGRSMVNNSFRATFSVHGAAIFLSAVAWSVFLSGACVSDFSVVVLNNGFHIFGAAVAKFDCFPIQYAVQAV